MDDAGTGQCANSRSFHRCVIIQRPEGKGRGLCDVRTRYSFMAYSRFIEIPMSPIPLPCRDVPLLPGRAEASPGCTTHKHPNAVFWSRAHTHVQ
jgi:hypothetical protein